MDTSLRARNPTHWTAHGVRNESVRGPAVHVDGRLLGWTRPFWVLGVVSTLVDSREEKDGRWGGIFGGLLLVSGTSSVLESVREPRGPCIPEGGRGVRWGRGVEGPLPIPYPPSERVTFWRMRRSRPETVLHPWLSISELFISDSSRGTVRRVFHDPSVPLSPRSRVGVQRL